MRGSGARAKGLAILALACAAISACDQPETIENSWPVAYDYALDLPPDFVRQDVSGIDSKVEEFRSPDTVISTDFGHYSARPDCGGGKSACDIEEEEIAGLDALVVRYRPANAANPGDDLPYRVDAHVEVAKKQGLALNMGAQCDSDRACKEALGYFRKVRIMRVATPDAPVGGDAPPPPPPR